MNREHGRVPHPGHVARFVEQRPGASARRLLVQIRVQQFERHHSIELGVTGLVHDAHGPRAQAGDDLELLEPDRLRLPAEEPLSDARAYPSELEVLLVGGSGHRFGEVIGWHVGRGGSSPRH
jgi:hypothetical protein